MDIGRDRRLMVSVALSTDGTAALVRVYNDADDREFATALGLLDQLGGGRAYIDLAFVRTAGEALAIS